MLAKDGVALGELVSRVRQVGQIGEVQAQLGFLTQPLAPVIVGSIPHRVRPLHIVRVCVLWEQAGGVHQPADVPVTQDRGPGAGFCAPSGDASQELGWNFIVESSLEPFKVGSATRVRE